MKKLLFIAALISLTLPFTSFKTESAAKSKYVLKKVKAFTDWYVGDFDYNGVQYHVYGDNMGGTSGNVVGVSDNAGPVASVTGTWSYTYGIGHHGLGVNVFVTPVESDSFSYEDLVYQ